MKIEKGIAIPEKPRSGGRPTKYPFKVMEVGDSVFIDEAEAKAAIAAARATGRIHGKKFVYRTVDGGIRIWRAA